MKRQKKQGDIAEKELIDFLNKQNGGFPATLNIDDSKRYDYDVEMDISFCSHGTAMKMNGLLTFEVKHDVMAKKTGNVAIEFHNSKKNEPSGIYVTKANIWAHKILDEIWLCSVSDLKEFVKNEKPVKIVIAGGDDNADLFIFTIDQFTAICTPLSSITHVDDILNML